MPIRSRDKMMVLRLLLLVLVLACLRLTTVRHPWPVHGDELEFVAALGFSHPYPVHHPGYPLWVGLGTLLNVCGISPYAAYVAWSLAASCLGPVILFIALKKAAGERAAWWSALALGVNPLWWFHGVTALNYSVANGAALLIVLLCWRAFSRESRTSAPALWAALCLGVGMGLRIDMLLWLGPLVVVSAIRSQDHAGARSRVPLIFAVLALLAAFTIAWTAVTWWLYRGDDTGRLAYTVGVIGSTSVFSRGLVDGLVRNGVKLSAYLLWGVGVGLLPMIWSVVRLRRRRDVIPSGRHFLLFWIGPVLLFQLLIHVTEVGHALWYLPPAYAVLALGASTLGAQRVALLPAAAVFASLAQFYFYPWRAEVSGRQRILNAKVAFVSAQGLARIDQRPEMHEPGDFWPVPSAPLSDSR